MTSRMSYGKLGERGTTESSWGTSRRGSSSLGASGASSRLFWGMNESNSRTSSRASSSVSVAKWATRSGVAHFATDTEEEALLLVRELLSFIPQNNLEDAPDAPNDDDPLREVPQLDSVVPRSPNLPYDMREVIKNVVDHGVLM